MRQSVHNLMEFPFVRDAVAAGTLEVRGAFFTLFSGKLKILGDDGVFRDSPITGAAHSTSLATTSSKYCTGARHTIHRMVHRRSPSHPPNVRPSCVDIITLHPMTPMECHSHVPHHGASFA